MPSPDKSIEDYIREATDILALGFPHEGSEEEKAAYMDELRQVLEDRAAAVKEAFRRA